MLGFLTGALIPLFWGVLSFLLFNVPESRFSQIYWQAVYVTCPFWLIDFGKAWLFLPLLNGLMYAGIALVLVNGIRIATADRSRSRS